MPMIDVYAAAGTFSEKHKLAQDLANAVMKWENVPPINLFKEYGGLRPRPPGRCDLERRRRQQLRASSSAHSG